MVQMPCFSGNLGMSSGYPVMGSLTSMHSPHILNCWVCQVLLGVSGVARLPEGSAIPPDDIKFLMKVYYRRVWLPYLIVEGLSSRLQGVTHRKASCILEVKHAPLYTPKVSMVMIVIYLWCHRYVIQYWDHVFYHMHVSDIHPSTLISLLPSWTPVCHPKPPDFDLLTCLMMPHH